MRTGLGLLQLSPDVLWSMTPRELSAAIEGASGSLSAFPSLDRSKMENLMSRYPDV